MELYESIAREAAAAAGLDSEDARFIYNTMKRAIESGDTPENAIVSAVYRAYRRLYPETLLHLFYGSSTCDGCSILQDMNSGVFEQIDGTTSPCERCMTMRVRRFMNAC